MIRATLAPDGALPDGAPPPPWPGRAVEVDGATMYVRETPPTVPGAEPALYVHGLGGSAANWTDLAGLLAGRLDGQAIDLPGFGFSDPLPRCSVAAFADRVARWIEHSGRGPVHLFGNSLGGAIAVRVAGCRPELVRSLTLVSPAMPFLNPRRSLQGRVLPLLAVPRAERIAARLLAQIEPAEMARQVIAACFGDPTRLGEQRMAEAIEEVRLRYEVAHYPRVYLHTLRGLVFSFLRAYLPGSNSLWRIARQITVPTLVIGGRHDRLVDIRVPPQVARVIPDSRLLLLAGVGHVAQMEVPRTVARAALALLDEARSAGQAVPVPAHEPATAHEPAQAHRPAPADIPALAHAPTPGTEMVRADEPAALAQITASEPITPPVSGSAPGPSPASAPGSAAAVTSAPGLFRPPRLLPQPE